MKAPIQARRALIDIENFSRTQVPTVAPDSEISSGRRF